MVFKSRRIPLQALLLLLITAASTNVSASPPPDPWSNIQDKVIGIVCSFRNVFSTAATGIAGLVMVIAGIQWVSSEADPGARKKAKTSMIHAIVGLIIISIANQIAGLVLTGCP
jgi:hypothetical protein